MKHSFHCHLRKSLRWYHHWHDHPRHQHSHWAFFAVIAILTFSFISSGIQDFYSENEYIGGFINTARAQTYTSYGPPPYGNACEFNGQIVPGYIYLGEAS